MQTLASPEVVRELEQRVLSLSATDVSRWGSMTAGEMVMHVSQAFRMALGERAVARVEGRSTLERKLLKTAALRLPMTWPQGVPTVPELKREVLPISELGFVADRAELRDDLVRMARLEGTPGDHPIFGAMSRWDWMRWGFLHTDHHLRQFGR